jgi:hypothetical protein
MSRDRGVRLQNALAAYLRQWWRDAESAGSGRPGSDVLKTPGVVWENKTSGSGHRNIGAWIDQAAKHKRTWPGQPQDESSDLPIVVYWPPGVGDARPALAIAMLPLGELMPLLERAGYTEGVR